MSQNLRLPWAQSGMTLIEVLVALAIVAMTLTAGIKAAGGLGVNAQRMQNLTLGQMCVENQLTALKVSKAFPSVGDGDFSCVMVGRTLPGKLSIRPTPNQNFRRVDASVFDEDGSMIVKLTTIVPRF